MMKPQNKINHLAGKLKEFSDLGIDTSNIDIESIAVLDEYINDLTNGLSINETMELLKAYGKIISPQIEASP